ncbi:ABC transporter [Kitasatospora sp. NPDC049285]|uniref:ABC transporter n=1 Tax=Kitasatospora sp. NPDC049285 TaxID=3157096 RepID=UPI003431B2C6
MTVRALTRYHFALLVRSQRWVPPVLAYVLAMVVGVAAGDEELGALGYAAGVLVPVTAWLVRTVVTAEPAASRGCLVAAAGWWRVHLGALLAAVLAAAVPAAAGIAGVLATGGGSRAGAAPTLLAGALAAGVCLALGAAIGAVCNRPVLRRSPYGIPLALAGAVAVLVLPGSPANAVVRALVAGSAGKGLVLPWWTAPAALGLAAAAVAGAVALAGRDE